MRVEFCLYRKSGIYKITNTLTGDFYIGSSGRLYNRLFEHFRDLRLGKHRTPKMQNSYNKYGEENFKYEILEFCDKDILLEREQYYFDTKKPTFNVYLTAESCKRTLSIETKKLIGKKSKQKFVDRPELKEILAEARRRRGSWNKGRTKVYSPETLKKMSDHGKLRGADFLQTPEIREKRKKVLRESIGKPVLISNAEGTLSFESISEALEFIGILNKHAASNISSGIKGNRVRYGYFWKYKI